MTQFQPHLLTSEHHRDALRLVYNSLVSIHSTLPQEHPRVLVTAPGTNGAASQPVLFTCLSSKINRNGPEKLQASGGTDGLAEALTSNQIQTSDNWKLF